MGRKKIEIKPITDKKSRKDTFHKRKVGLVKKAAELSMLCNVKMLLVFEDLAGDVVKYSTHGLYDPVQYFTEEYLTTPIAFTAKHYPDFFKNITVKKRVKDEECDLEGGDGSDGGDYEDIESTETDQRTLSETQPGRLTKVASSTSSMMTTPKSQASFSFANKSNAKQKGDNHLFQQLHQQAVQSNNEQNQKVMGNNSGHHNHQHHNQNVFDFNIAPNLPNGQSAVDSQEARQQNFQNRQMGKKMDLEVINEEKSEPMSAGYQVGNTEISNSRAEECDPVEPKHEPKYVAFKREFKPKLKISEEEESKKVTHFTNNLLSPNLFTQSPIGYVMSPIPTNLNSSIYEFNEMSILQGKGLPTPGKTNTPGKMQKMFSQFPGTYGGGGDFGVTQHQNAGNAQFFNQVRPEGSLEVEDFLNKNGEKGNYLPPYEDHFAGMDFAGKNTFKPTKELPRQDNQMNFSWNIGQDTANQFPANQMNARGDKFFGFGMYNNSDNEMARNPESFVGDHFAVPRARDDPHRVEQSSFRGDYDSSGMRLYSPFPLPLVRSNQNTDWLQYFYLKQSDRTMQDESFSLLNNSRGNDLSLSIAKSPKPGKKLKDN